MSNEIEETEQIGEFVMTSRDEMICSLLSQGWTHVLIAEEVGCSTKTIQRLLKDSEFAAELRALRRARVSATTATLELLGATAVQQLIGLMANGDDRTRLAAAKTVLDMGRRHHRQEFMDEEFLTRLEEVEQQVADAGSSMSRTLL